MVFPEADARYCTPALAALLTPSHSVGIGLGHISLGFLKRKVPGVAALQRVDCMAGINVHDQVKLAGQTRLEVVRLPADDAVGFTCQNAGCQQRACKLIKSRSQPSTSGRTKNALRNCSPQDVRLP